MKKIIVLVSGLACEFVFAGSFAQSPTCSSPVGTWQSQTSATSLVITAVIPATNELTGTIQQNQGDAITITGWISQSNAIAGKHHTTPVTFSLQNNLLVQSWTGHCSTVAGTPTITTIWHMVRANADSNIEHTLTGTDVFQPAANAFNPTPTPDSTATITHTYIRNASCPMQGSGKNGNPPAARMIALNLLKNRDNQPMGVDYDNTVGFPQLYNSDDDMNRFDQHKAAVVTGYLFDVRPEKGESCNCYSTSDADHDFHIYIGNANANSIFDCVVVEMTPYSRATHPEWTLNYVKGLKGKKVKVSGWLMYDFEHTSQSYDTNPNTHSPYRHTVWEIHPVTGLTLAQ